MKKVILLVSVLLCAALLCSCTVPSFSSQSMENPKITLERFVESLQARDFESAMDMVGNYSSFAFEDYSLLEEASAEKIIADYILDSYQITFPDEECGNVFTGHSSEGLSINGREATIEFEMRFFDLGLLTEQLTLLVTEEGSERMFHGEVYETQEQVLALAREVLVAHLSEEGAAEQYYTTQQFEITAVYVSGDWELQITDEFYSALVGSRA